MARCHDRVGERADPTDAADGGLALFHEHTASRAHSGRAARSDDVARPKCQDVRHEAHHLGHAVCHPLGCGILHCLAAQRELDRQLLRIRYELLGNEVRTQRCERAVPLSDEPVRAVPAIGAAGGALVNVAFNAHFDRVARYHFGIRALERKYGIETVQATYQKLLESSAVK